MARIDAPPGKPTDRPEAKSHAAETEAANPENAHRFTDLMARPDHEHGGHEAQGEEHRSYGLAGTGPGGTPSPREPVASQDAGDKVGAPLLSAEHRQASRMPGPAEAPFRDRPGEGPATHGGIRTHQDQDPRDEAASIAAEGGFAVPGTPPAPEPFQPLGPVATPEAPQTADTDLIAELAERILVAEPEAGHGEVRIRLNLNTLQGAEISIRQDAYGLHVAFETPSPEIAERLAEARGELAGRLTEKTGQPATIEISSPRHDASSDTGDGRSRNRFDYGPESGDDA